jgi:putative serine protease PepD
VPERAGGRTIASLVLVAGVGAGVLAGILFAAGAIHTRTATSTIVSQVGSSAPETEGFLPSDVYAAAAPAVVDITTRTITHLQTPLGPALKSTGEAGAGTIIDHTGDVLTAAHVVAGASAITVKLQSGAVRTAKLLGRDSSTDLAVVKFDPRGLVLHPIPFGKSKSLRIGDPILTIGDPFGYERSLSAGIVSALDRTIEEPNGFSVAHAIQTDAALNPGNSGGPLLDSNGRLVGVADQIASSSSSETNTGVGFGVPIDLARAELSQLEHGVSPNHAYLGIAATDAGPSGALVQIVRAGSPAAEAGIVKGDVIVAVGSTKIMGVGDLVAAIATRHAGNRITVTLERDSGKRTVTLVLAPQPANAPAA